MNNIALIVDDIEINREILSEILADDFEILEAGDGAEALEVIEQYQEKISVLLLDMIMPRVDGMAVLKKMNLKGWNITIPVLVVSAEQSYEIQEQCFELGVFDFIPKPYQPQLIRQRAKNAAELYRYKNALERQVWHQTEELRKQNDRLKEINSDIIELLGDVVEARNLESGQHVRRVKQYTAILAEEMMQRYPEYGLTPEQNEIIATASALHDIGKIMISDSVLLKPGKLTKEEFEYMKTHTTLGVGLLDKVKGIWFDEYGKECHEICHYHHERWDGRGYPEGLKGDEIPISAQLVSIADVYDALTTERPYKHAFSTQKAYDMITHNECGVFSPKLMDCFEHCREQFEILADKNAALLNAEKNQ